jgi:hypothetical protein
MAKHKFVLDQPMTPEEIDEFWTRPAGEWDLPVFPREFLRHSFDQKPHEAVRALLQQGLSNVRKVLGPLPAEYMARTLRQWGESAAKYFDVVKQYEDED